MSDEPDGFEEPGGNTNCFFFSKTLLFSRCNYCILKSG
jgi:hypothetical protein